MAPPPLRAIVSIHDVMPETRPQVTRMLQTLSSSTPHLTAADITLLIVPGRQWMKTDLDWLHQLVAKGHPLAGHGWLHQAPLKRTFYHVLHSLLLSRNAAEHLSQKPQDLKQLVNNCFYWFYQRGLPRPQLYVPPAWAAGKLELREWKQLPFSQLETLSGVTHLYTGHHVPLPLTGYEADNRIRATVLRFFNFLNKQRARRSGKPLRIGLHPFDLDYFLARHALSDLNRVDQFCRYSDLH